MSFRRLVDLVTFLGITIVRTMKNYSVLYWTVQQERQNTSAQTICVDYSILVQHQDRITPKQHRTPQTNQQIETLTSTITNGQTDLETQEMDKGTTSVVHHPSSDPTSSRLLQVRGLSLVFVLQNVDSARNIKRGDNDRCGSLKSLESLLVRSNWSSMGASVASLHTTNQSFV